MTVEKSEIALSPIGELLRAAGGDVAIAMETFRKKASAETLADESSASTVAARKAEYKRMLDEYAKGEGGMDALIAMGERLGQLVNKITALDLSTHDGALSAEQAAALMDIRLGAKEATELLDVYNKGVLKVAVFAHMDAQLAVEGVKDPQNHNATLDVPEFGRKFSREGAGYTDPTLDEGRLRMRVGEEVWQEICEAEEVPAHVEYTFSLKKLFDRAEQDPVLYNTIGECMTFGEPKAPRLNDRKMT
jgi:hypothetical protein